MAQTSCRSGASKPGLRSSGKKDVKVSLTWPELKIRSWLRVDMEKEPEEWMLSSAIACDAALHICHPPTDTVLQEKTVIHINVFIESDRPANCKGMTFNSRNRPT